jgi:hypothetical protein
MGDIIRQVSYYKIETPDRPGEGARVLGALRDAGINLLAYTGFPRGRRAQLDLVPEDDAAFKQAAKQAKLKLSPKKVGFLAQGDDRPGAIAEILERLARAKINVTAMDAVNAGNGRYGAIFWVKSKDARKAAQAVGAQ